MGTKKLTRCQAITAASAGAIGTLVNVSFPSLAFGSKVQDKLCSETVIFSQNILLGSANDMEDIVRAITKIYENRETL